MQTKQRLDFGWRTKEAGAGYELKRGVPGHSAMDDPLRPAVTPSEDIEQVGSRPSPVVAFLASVITSSICPPLPHYFVVSGF